MIDSLITFIQLISQLMTILVIASAVLSFFMSPFHPVRNALDRIVNPLLAPIRKVVPPVQNIDFSPLIFIVLLEIITSLVVRLLVALR
ncbi:MAG: YggT family protein [Anaerolineales bacterium]